MSDAIKSVLGLVVNKARSATASHMSDGDLTDGRFREAIISDIDDIKSSLRGLARERLEGSVSFLKEAISRMGLAVRQKSASTQNVETATFNLMRRNLNKFLLIDQSNFTSYT